MSWWNGISECYWISSTCVLDWDAASAVATAAGVLAALAAPAVTRIRQRRRANALLALSFSGDIAQAWARAESIARDYPFGLDGPESQAAQERFMDESDYRAQFARSGEPLRVLAQRELDLSKWPQAIDLGVAERVAVAIHAAQRLCVALEAGSEGSPNAAGWGDFWTHYRRDVDFAVKRLDEAWTTCLRASRKSRYPAGH
ncbi:hypothetical protein [Stenotrophomonas maltophilia]|uniref:hypothetical protein n=1 Tax=Stenotrophomonas maltophilia TaxID=40324 RepID=UPI0039C37030